MKEATTIRAVEVVRRIRDEQARQWAEKSPDDIIAFFRQAGKEARKAAQDRLSSTGNPKGVV